VAIRTINGSLNNATQNKTRRAERKEKEGTLLPRTPSETNKKDIKKEKRDP